MTDLRADARWLGRALALALIALTATGGGADAQLLSQAGPPVRLTPSAPVEAAPAAEPARPGEPLRGPGIEVGEPSPVDTSAVGLSEPLQLGLRCRRQLGRETRINHRLMRYRIEVKRTMMTCHAYLFTAKAERKPATQVDYWNTPCGSWGMIQIQPTRKPSDSQAIPLPEGRGWFKTSLP